MPVKISSLSLRYIRVREEDRQETFTINVAMIKEVIKIGIDQNSGDRIPFSGRKTIWTELYR